MCIGGSPKAQPLPPPPPAAPTMADPAVIQARSDAQQRLRGKGLVETQLNTNLGGQGVGSKKLGRNSSDISDQ